MDKIIIAAANGFLGNALLHHFKDRYHLVALVRRIENPLPWVTYCIWDGVHLDEWQHELEGALAIINLAGKSINCRYTEANKKAILSSRLISTKVIGEAIRACTLKPQVWVNCSSMAVYPISWDVAQTESAPTNDPSFLAEVSRQWETMFYSFADTGVRPIVLRISVVLGKGEGALKPLVPLVKLGLGGKSGSGKQMFSWIHVDDICRAIEFLMLHNQAQGHFNMGSPNPVTNEAFMKALRKTLHMPFGLPQPSWMVQLGSILIGTEAELVLASRCIAPKKLLDAGFTFSYENIDQALENVLHA